MTLAKVIQRFEDEYPETRLPTESNGTKIEANTEDTLSPISSRVDSEPGIDDELAASDAEEEPFVANLSRRNSEVSLASKALNQEEGRMLRVGQRIRREFMPLQSADHLTDTNGDEPESAHMQMLRAKMESFDGHEIADLVNKLGIDGLLKDIGMTLKDYQKIMREDPSAFSKFQEAQQEAQLAEAAKLAAQK
jgi:hypothetical protein